MRPIHIALTCAGLLAAQAYAQPPSTDATAAEATAVSVRFVKPKTFTDATYENRPRSRQRVTQDVAAYLTELGRRHLAPQRRLHIEITDIDLAGRYEPWQLRQDDVRFMREVTWPRIELKYRVLDEAGAVLNEGEDKITDMHYLGGAQLRAGSDRLRYEKAMLDKWFRERFVAGSL